jgi:glycosyltransferase involved in cell wall biosynthesis
MKHRLKSTLQKYKVRLQQILAFRLGHLIQHGPKNMRLPAHYNKSIKLNHYPKISIVTPSFKQADFIERTINSIIDQNYPNLEYFVQDGGSQDGTEEILSRYTDKISGWESRKDNGQSQAINLGLNKTSGEIMAWLNSDDLLLPGSLAYVASYFNRHPKVDVVYGHRILIDENDQQIGRWMLPKHNNEVLSWADYIPQETLFWRRSIWDKAGSQIDESFRFAMDWDLLIRFREAGAKFARLPRFMGAFRIHMQQKTSAEISGIGIHEMTRIRERLLGRVPSDEEIYRAVIPYMKKHIITDLGWRILNKLGMSF